MAMMSGAGMLGAQFQQRGEESDTFKVRRLCPCNWFCLLESQDFPSLQVHIQSWSKQSLFSLWKSIVVCVCVIVPRCWDHPSWMALWQMLPASAGWGFPWGRAREDVPIGGDTLMYTCMYMCTCLYVSSIKTTAHLVVLVCTLVQNVHKTCVVWSMWSQGMDKDSVCGSSAVVVDLLRPDRFLH